MRVVLSSLRTGRTNRQLAGLCAVLLALPWAAFSQEKVTYQDHVLPLIENNCGKCHNPDKKKGDLDLTSYNAALKGGGSGQVLVAGNPDSSKLFKAITHAEDPTMPPNKPRLPDKEIDVFKKWIAGGLLETSGSKAIAAKPSVDLTLKVSSVGKPEGPLPMPKDLPLEPVVHTEKMTALTGLAASPWAPLIAVAGEKQILVYNSDSLELLGILPFPEGFPVEVRFSRSGKLLMASGGRGGKSGRVLVWDIVSGDRVMTIGNEYDTVLTADISPDQTRIALGGPSRLVKIYSTKEGELIHKMKKHTDWVNSVAFSPSGEILASADRNGGITTWEAENGQELYTLAGHKASVTALSWRGDSKVFASASEDGTVKLWDPQESRPVKSWNAHNGGVLWVSYTHDGRLVSCGRDNQIVTWDANGNKLKAMQYTGELPLRASFSHDGQRVFGTDFFGHVMAWNTKDGKKVGDLDPNPLSLAQQLQKAQQTLEAMGATNAAAAELESVKATVAKVTAAQSQSTFFHAKEELAARKGEQERLRAVISEKQATIKQSNEKLTAAKDSATKSKLRAAIKTITGEIKTAEAEAKKLAVAVAAEETHLAKLRAEYERIKTASSSAVQQSKL